MSPVLILCCALWLGATGATAATFALLQRFTHPTDVYALGGDAVGDVNRDGKPDLVTIEYRPQLDSNGRPASHYELLVMFGSGQGYIVAPIRQRLITVVAEQSLGKPTVADVNGDGKLDVLFFFHGARLTGGLYVALGNGDGSFQTPTRESYSGPVFSIDLGDVNKDGKLDIAAAGSNVRLLMGNGDGSFRQSVGFGIPPSGYSSAAKLADLNFDANLDLVVIPSGGSEVQVYLGNGDGTLGTVQRFFLPLAPGVSLSLLDVADVNRDGKPDVMVGGTGGAWLLPGTGYGTLQQAIRITARPLVDFALVDVFCDCKVDLVATLTDGVVVFPGTGSLRFGPELTFAGGGGPLAVVDMNHDALLDLVTDKGILLQRP